MPDSHDVGEQLELLRGWLQEANPEMSEIADDTDIIDSRVLSSLQFVEFILYIEEVRGSSIDFDQVDIESVRTLKNIEHHYLATVGSAAGVSS